MDPLSFAGNTWGSYVIRSRAVMSKNLLPAIEDHSFIEKKEKALRLIAF